MSPPENPTPAAPSDPSEPPPPAAANGKGKKKDEKKDDDLSEGDLALKEQLEPYVAHVQDTDPGLQKLALESMRKADEIATEFEKRQSEVDVALKELLELYVVRAQDADPGVQKLALESMRQEIRSATSSMTSVPKVLKFLRPHYITLKSHFETMPQSELKKYMADILSVLALTSSVDGDRESQKYRLLGFEGDIGSWSHDYVRNYAGENAQEFEKHLKFGSQDRTEISKASVMVMPKGLKNLAMLAFFEDNYCLSLKLINEAINEEPSAELYSDRAQLNLKLERFEDAVNDCDEAIRLDGSFAIAFYRKGMAYKSMKMFERARATLLDGYKLAVPGSRVCKLIKDAITEIEACISKEAAIGASSSRSAKTRVFLIYDKKMKEHRPNSTNDAENAGRYDAIIKKIEEEGLLSRCAVASTVSLDHVNCISDAHSKKYIDAVKDLAIKSRGKPPSKTNAFFGPSIVCSPGTERAASLAACAVIEACKRVAVGSSDASFAIVRPPGHHAKEELGSGFCFFNNVAIGAMYLKSKHDAKKILIVDFDVHHGDGTQAIFYSDNTVLFCSVHRSDIFPYNDDGFKKHDKVGTGDGTGYNVNVNLTGPINDGDMLAVFDHVFLPLSKCFNPDFVLVSAGYDAAVNDKLGASEVTPKCYGELACKLKSILNGRIVFALEGGYNLESLSQCCAESIRALVEDKVEGYILFKPAHKSTWSAIKEVHGVHKSKWPIFGEIKLPEDVT